MFKLKQLLSNVPFSLSGLALCITTLNLGLLTLNSYAQYTKLLNFSGASNGSNPYLGSLISDGTFLYGMTFGGGTNNLGTIFKIKPDGTGYSKLLNFTGTNGSNPRAGLIFDGTFLYGMTRHGGTYDTGVVFKIKPDGTEYSKLLDFGGGAANGKHPYGSLTSDGTFLYGMTRFGGTYNMGIIFKIKPDGTGYFKLLDFSGAATGSRPPGSLFSDGTFLYGTTYFGGTNDRGTIFKIKSDGTGFSKLLDFSGINGGSPYGTLISDGTFLYGMTWQGGTSGRGTIFKIKSDGTAFSKLHNFTVINGAYPYGSLISDGTFLYGMTAHGGAYDPNSIPGSTGPGGVLFKIKLDGTGFSKLLDFSGAANGSYPNGDLISDGNFLYGMTANGGTNDRGTIFKYGITTGVAENNTETDFNVYPNPTNGIFDLQITMGDLQFERAEIKIYNVLGDNVFQSKINTQQCSIDLSFQCVGVYFIQVKTNNDIATQKLIISR